nr:type I restriction endonuclease [uncultured Clostridium sp.]
MDFIDELKLFSERVKQRKEQIPTEEATKMSLIVPFFQLLGYDVFNPDEFMPEYVADVGIKKGEKVDYAILFEGKPVILIECKWCGSNLDQHSSQLFRYFGTSTAKFGILTNGIVYRFYTDLDESNKMDLTPFLEINMLDIKESYVNELKKFSKQNFDVDNIFNTASELKYSKLIKEYVKTQLDNPDDNFVKFILSSVYDGVKTQNVIDKFKPIVKKSFNGFINETMNDKISSALKSNDEVAVTEQMDLEESEHTDINQSGVITTEEEIQSFYMIKGMLAEFATPSDITYRDTESYFGILYKDNNRKPICRINLDKKKRQILIPDENKNFTRHYIDTMDDIYNYKQELIDCLNRYL